jgi:hypothetical protein
VEEDLHKGVVLAETVLECLFTSLVAPRCCQKLLPLQEHGIQRRCCTAALKSQAE